MALKSARTIARCGAFFIVCTVICGVLYPAVCTGIAQVAFPYQANGSIIEVDGVKYGSEVVGQQFNDADHMWGRVMYPDASTFTTDDGKAAVWYGPSNLGPAGADFEAAVQARIEQIRAAHPEKGDAPIPSDLVTCSGSGFDPHISPAAAEYQVDRLAKNTGKSPEEIRAIIRQCTEGPTFGVLGDARVNVLKVNLMLDGVL